jgi:hypothetical protein
MEILKETGIDRHEKRLISKLYMDQCSSMTRPMGEGQVKIGRGLDKDDVTNSI